MIIICSPRKPAGVETTDLVLYKTAVVVSCDWCQVRVTAVAVAVDQRGSMTFER